MATASTDIADRMVGGRTKLDWLEVGRGFAALGVVIAHFDPWRGGTGFWSRTMDTIALGGMCVEFFFLLSGFIIFYVHGRDIGQPARAGHYASRRLIRVMPTYWAMLALVLVFNQTLQNPDYRHDLTAPFLMQQIFLLPGEGLAIGPAWTLRHELLFYMLFGLAILNRRLGTALILLWMSAVVVHFVLTGVPDGHMMSATGIILHHYNLDFLIGIGAALAVRASRLGLYTLVSSALTAPLFLAWAATGFTDTLWQIMAYKPLFATVLGGLIMLAQAKVRAPAVLVRLGTISYTLYISHELVGVVISGGLKRLGLRTDDTLAISYLASVLIAIAVATLFYRWFERPVLYGLRAAMDGRPRKAATAGSTA